MQKARNLDFFTFPHLLEPANFVQLVFTNVTNYFVIWLMLILSAYVLSKVLF